MNVHKNASLTPAGRARLVAAVLREGERPAAVARQFRVSVTTVRRWVRRAEAGETLQDHSSRPRRLARQHPRPVRRRVEKLRRRRASSLRIARETGLPLPTVVTMLRRLGLNRLPALAPPEPVVRYERARPGELLHVDIKKLGRIRGIGHRITGRGPGTYGGRGAGWECVHVALDDCTRLAYAEVLADEQGTTTAAFLERALAWFRARGVVVERLLSDNGACYRSRVVRAVLDAHGVRHLFTRAFRPQTNGKAERFIRTLLAEWAYARAYPTSCHRTARLPAYLDHYNAERPHGGLGFITPQQRLATAQ